MDIDRGASPGVDRDQEPASRTTWHLEDAAALPDGRVGRCLCGAVRYRLVGPLRDVINCHCERCRRATGHFMAATATALGDLVLESADSLEWHHPGDDPAVSYGFCRACGSTLFWRSSDDAAQWSVAAGTIEPPTGLHTAAAWFCSRASDYHALDPDVVQFDLEPAGSEPSDYH